MIRVLFYGTSSLGIPSLKTLLNDKRFFIIGAVTQPDRPAGRHAKPQASPIKQFAQNCNLPIYQFEKVKNDEAYEVLKTLSADVALVASFGQILSQRILDLYPHGIINIHPSLLPKYRGSTPIQAPIKNGDKKTGISIMKLDALMDHGPLLAQIEEPIQSEETGASLEQRLSEISGNILPDILFQYVNGQIQPQEQNHEEATIVKMLSREDGLIDWKASAQAIERMVRAYTPWPGTYTMVDGKRLKIFETKFGEVEGYPQMMCGDQNILSLIRIQPEGKSVMNGKDYLHGKQAGS